MTMMTFVFEPPRLSDAFGTSPERRSRFIDALGRHSGVPVAVTEAPLREAMQRDGFILANAESLVSLSELAEEERSALAPRFVAVGVSRPRIFQRVLEPLQIAAAVDGMTLFEWEEERPETVGARGPHGRKDVAAKIGATCLLFESQHYCYLASESHHGLPHLLADYLAALHTMHEERR